MPHAKEIRRAIRPQLEIQDQEMPHFSGSCRTPRRSSCVVVLCAGSPRIVPDGRVEVRTDEHSERGNPDSIWLWVWYVELKDVDGEVVDGEVRPQPHRCS